MENQQAAVRVNNIEAWKSFIASATNGVKNNNNDESNNNNNKNQDEELAEMWQYYHKLLTSRIERLQKVELEEKERLRSKDEDLSSLQTELEKKKAEAVYQQQEAQRESLMAAKKLEEQIELERRLAKEKRDLLEQNSELLQNEFNFWKIEKIAVRIV